MSSYYVYVYIDPRSLEEFYYGKGKGSRKDVHLTDASDTKKAKQIADIKKQGLKPIVRVIARNLSEREALLVEKTLLWKLGKWTANVATGHFADRFRPPNTLHKELSGFDFENGVYYYNVGEGPTRNWDDYRKFGFISAGQGTRWRDAMLGFNVGDVIVAYLKTKGFVGVGKVTEQAQMVKSVTRNRKPLLKLPLKSEGMAKNSDDPEHSEYVALVDWIKAVPRDGAKWRPGLFATQSVRASLDNQPKTIRFIEEQFRVSVKDLIA